MSSNENQNSENNDNSYQATAETNYEILTNSSTHTASITTFVVAAASPTAVDQLPPPPSAEIQSGVTVAVPSPIPMGIGIGTTSGAATSAEMMSTMSTIFHHSAVSGEQRERPEEDAAAGGSAQKRARGKLDAPKKSEPMCALCSKKFGSWKAVFGHMRSHPERVWRGAFPPPVGGWSSSPERAAAVLAAEEERDMLVDQLAPTLLNIATETVARLEEEENQEELGGGAERKRRRGWGISIDLNELPTGSGPGSGSSSVSSRGDDSIDLNRPPRNSDRDEPETGGGGDDAHHR